MSKCKAVMDQDKIKTISVKVKSESNSDNHTNDEVTKGTASTNKIDNNRQKRE